MTEPIVDQVEVEAPASDALPTGFRGPIIPVNVRSGDGREFVLPPDAEIEPHIRPYPLAMQAQKQLLEGHDSAVIVGIITRAWLAPYSETDQRMFIWAEGPLDLNDEDGAAWARKLHEGFAGWVSADMSDVVVEEVLLDKDGVEIPVPDDTGGPIPEPSLVPAADDEEPAPPEPMPEIASVAYRFTDWKLMGATFVGGPAFEDARVAPVYGDEFTATDAGEALLAAANVAEQTGAMVALIPMQEDIDRLAIPGGEDPAELHVTMAYLGDAVEWPDDARVAVEAAVREIAGSAIDGTVWGHASFNPDGDDPCAVYLVEGEKLPAMRDAVLDIFESQSGFPALPQQHEPFVPHITAGYGLSVSELSATGPVRFDRLRIAFAGENVDIELAQAPALVAAGAPVYNAADFEIPELDEPTTLQVDENGRVFGHLAEWGSCHIGYASVCITPPSSPTSYRYFHQKPVMTDRGPLGIGKLTLGTGHAPGEASATAAAAHYDNTGTAVAVVRCHDGKIGPWVSGHIALGTGVTDEQIEQLRLASISGDWRDRGQGLDLIAALAVNTPGFEIRSARAVAASGVRSLVAAGVLRPKVHPAEARSRARLRESDVVPRPELRAFARALIAEMTEEKIEAAARTKRVGAATSRVLSARELLAAKRVSGA